VAQPDKLEAAAIATRPFVSKFTFLSPCRNSQS